MAITLGTGLAGSAEARKAGPKAATKTAPKAAAKGPQAGFLKLLRSERLPDRLQVLADPTLWMVQHAVPPVPEGEQAAAREVARAKLSLDPVAVNAIADCMKFEELAFPTASALVSIGGGKLVVDALMSALATPTSAQAGVWGLGTLKADRAYDKLLTMLKHPNGDVRGAAADALARFGDARACVPLTALLGERTMSTTRQVKWGDVGTAAPTASVVNRGSLVANQALDALIDCQCADTMPAIERARNATKDVQLRAKMIAAREVLLGKLDTDIPLDAATLARVRAAGKELVFLSPRAAVPIDPFALNPARDVAVIPPEIVPQVARLFTEIHDARRSGDPPPTHPRLRNDAGPDWEAQLFWREPALKLLVTRGLTESAVKTITTHGGGIKLVFVESTESPEPTEPADAAAPAAVPGPPHPAAAPPPATSAPDPR